MGSGYLRRDRDHDEPLFEMACIFPGRATDAALLILDPATGVEHWIPWSQIEECHGRKEGQRCEGTIIMREWIAVKKGLTK
jgi:hypothetical protein